jgi:xanthine dehydrogenase molybdenum-binding subunit
LDMPEIEVILLDHREPTGPFGAKGAGEPGCVNQAAAIANALREALGVRVWRLPITAEKVLAAYNDAADGRKAS